MTRSSRLAAFTYCFVAISTLCAAATDVPSPPAIRINTLGYLPLGTKQATLVASHEPLKLFRASDGKHVLTIQPSAGTADQDTGELLATVDFTDWNEPGKYWLEQANGSRSAAFEIRSDLYREPFKLVARAMYLARCGTAVQGEWNGQTYAHAACHLNDGQLDFVAATEPATDQQRRVANGGWHDAGDYNKYVVNAGITIASMLRAWQDFRPQIEPIELDIPESAGPLPDLLAEVQWELNWLLTMQADDGSVYHKLSAADYCGYCQPEADHDTRYFGEPGTQATATFVAVMAMAARQFREFDADFADRCLAAAKHSYHFLNDHPEYKRPAQKGFTTAGYDTHDWSTRLWAAAEMWETTGDPAALADFEARATSHRPWPPQRRPGRRRENNSRRPNLQGEFDANWDWGNVQNLGLITYLESSRPGRDSQLVSRLQADLRDTAAGIAATYSKHGYGRPLGDRYFWGCNGVVARQVLILEAASRLEPRSQYRDASRAALDYLFGRNPYGRSFVTGLGDQPPLHPHDRRSASDEAATPWPGYLVGGPHPHASDWHDEQDDFRTNEIAINWNAALIYALAANLTNPAPASADRR